MLNPFTPKRSGSSSLNINADVFNEKYNIAPFVIRHNLHLHPLMQLDALAKLALRLPARQITHRQGVVEQTADFDRAHLQKPMRQSLAESFANLPEAGAQICINYPETDPEYGALIKSVYDEIAFHTAPFKSQISWYATHIFIASPGTITPYHTDRVINFLMHLHGPKRVKLWDKNVMSQSEIERLFGSWHSRRPEYRDELQQLASTFNLSPGDGLHHPFLAPHLIDTGTEVSVSIAMTYRTADIDRVIRLNKVNYQMRKIGLNPVAVGTSASRDLLKDFTIGRAFALRHRLSQHERAY